MQASIFNSTVLGLLKRNFYLKRFSVTGTLYGAINFVGTTTGFITPMVVGHFTAKQVSDNSLIFTYNFDFKRNFLIFQNTINEWSTVFMIAAVAYIIPAILFIIFGSGKVQKWNEPTTKEENVTTNQA